MVQGRNTESSKKYQSEAQKIYAKRYLIERAVALSLIILVLGVGIYIGNEKAEPTTSISFETLRANFLKSDIGGIVTGLERDVAVPLASVEPGAYAKGDLYVALTFGQAGEIRYSLQQKATATSALYAGRGINVYKQGVPKQTLYAIAIDPLGNTSDVAEYTYYFVPAAIKNFRAVPMSQGRVDLSWDASDDPEVSRYHVYVDKRDPVSAGKNTAYTVSGLTLSEHTFSVSAVDKHGMESPKETKTLLLSSVDASEKGDVHFAYGAEVTPDMNADGVVDYLDVLELFKALPEGPSTRELSALMQCWEKPGCEEEDMEN